MFDWGLFLGAIGVVIGLPALVLAVSPFCQMIWGRPKIEIDFVDFTGPEGKDLICSIYNAPVTNRLLKFVRVRRETGDLNAAFDIIEEGSNRAVLNAITGLIHDPTSRTSSLVVRARPHFHAGFPVIVCREGKTGVHDPRQEELIPIPPGQYRARVLVVCDDEPYVVEKALQLDADPAQTLWR